ncbi:MAG: hypothetical protein GXO48_00940 [Chlorobi bacterium]|nr:hypothetical protein [Chlorobiota bacterium]
MKPLTGKLAIALKALLFVLLGNTSLFASDPYGNEWLAGASKTFKFPITQEGIYRVNISLLQSLGLPSTAQAQELWLYYKGEPVPLFIGDDVGHRTGTLQPTDYIEFVGIPSNQTVDSLLYKRTIWISRTKSLFNDTAIYFLVWKPGTTNQSLIAHVQNDTSQKQPQITYFIDESVLDGSLYGKGRYFRVSNFKFYHGIYDLSEGRYYRIIYLGAGASTTLTTTVSTPHIISSMPANLEIIIGGQDYGNYSVETRVGGNTIYSGNGIGYTPIIISETISSGILSTNNTVEIDLTNNYSTGLQIGIAYIKLTYAKQWVATGTHIGGTVYGPGSGSMFIITGSFTGTTPPVLINLTDKQRVILIDSSGVLLGRLPFVSDTATVYAGKPIYITDIEEFVPPNIDPSWDYVIITIRDWVNDPSGLIQQYAQHRSSNIGGSFNVGILAVEDLYDMFAYGIKKHPLSIRNFVRFFNSIKTHDRNLQVFLIGGALPFSNSSWYANTLIPTFGDPPSDGLLTADPDSLCQICLTAGVGRLAIWQLQELEPYLQKVISHETELYNIVPTLDYIWTKNVIHLGGGKTTYEQQQIRYLMEQLEQIIEGPQWGATVTKVYKTGPAPIQVTDAYKVDSIIREGCVLITFTGHSSYNSFDITIDEPENYPNEGKFPVIWSNGCYVGNIFTDQPTLSKRFLLTPQKGTIGFYGGYDLTLLYQDYYLTRGFYTSATQLAYGEPIGTIFKDAWRLLAGQSSNDVILRQHKETFVFHGDPGIRLHATDKAEYIVSETYTWMSPASLSVLQDSFDLRFLIFNVGRSVQDSFRIYIEQTYPDGNTEVFDWKVPSTIFIDTVDVQLPVGDQPGLLRIRIFVDAANDIPEYDDYVNNEVVLTTYVSSTDAFPIYPYHLQRVDTVPVTLFAFSGDVFSPPQDYIIEIDTVATFSSPFKKREVIKGAYGLIRWTPPVNWEKNRVYYWRITPANDTTRWKTQSFTVSGFAKEVTSGWEQHHPYQWEENFKYGLKYDWDTRRFVFGQAARKISIISANYWYNTNAGTGNINIRCRYPKLLIDGMLVDRGCCARWWRWRDNNGDWRWNSGFGSIQFFAIDTATGMLLGSQDNDNDWVGDVFKDMICPFDGPRAFYGIDMADLKLRIFETPNWTIDTAYSQDVLQEQIIDFVNSLPQRYYFGAYAIGGRDAPKPSLWKLALRSLFASLGVEVDSICDVCPWFFFTKLGDPTFQPVFQSGDTLDILFWDTIVSGYWPNGFMESPLIGPAGQWYRIQWDYDGVDNTLDSAWLTVYAVDRFGQEKIIIPRLFSKDTTITFIQARDYPYLRLRLFVKDDGNATPVQLKYWRVLYDPLPEFVYDPMSHLVVPNKDSFLNGEPLEIEIAVMNVSDFPSDSLTVKWFINGTDISKQYMLKSFKPKDTTIWKISVNTRSARGNVLIFATLNPFIASLGRQAQPEAYAFNNTFQLPFYVLKDPWNPFIDVTFDGRRIFDGDYVSPNPVIEITLRDEHPCLKLNDTSLMNIFIVDPDNKIKRVPFNSPDIEVIPATLSESGDNRMVIRWNPTFTKDGTYELRVQGMDVSGNSAGKYDYRVSFKVDRTPRITNIFPYPNPFTTSTQFVFVLTGYKVPDDIRIQIFTISGRLVREITKEELGPIHIGTNITKFAWDGTDQWGRPLGNGVYLYRVFIRYDDGTTPEHFETSADRFFHKGWGKLYIVR